MTIKRRSRTIHSFPLSQIKDRRKKFRYVLLDISSLLRRMSKGINNEAGAHHLHTVATSEKEALYKARNCPGCAQDPVNVALLNNSIDRIWKKIQTYPEYVLSRDEFAFFNYFQSRFEGLQVARDARKRYWDNIHFAV
ncbi:putative peptide-n4-asparagineamidase [Erysiphe neolycopersici]|uniref:Putative peptide-n4-asparagineamidase n=1 Tax=Erysiphe neolycopersici TaxID=212602 RepID=A0A420HZ25_9PEZI|nr:putative peptide-n4-asparagineamidase [Erysiphe neolycopersici]